LDKGKKQMTEEALIDGYARQPAYIHIKTSNESIEFSSDTGFGALLTNSLLTDNGQTVGERNRTLLHERLDAWLDKTVEDNNGTV
jgi:hypothetical protein